MKINNLVDTTPINQTEQDNLWVNYENGSQEAKDALVNSHLRMVESMVSSMMNSNTAIKDKDDLFQSGCVGLLEALEKYDPSKGTKFTTYAYYHIFKRIWETYTGDDRTIRLPQGVLLDITKLIKAESAFYDENHRVATDQEISEITGFTLDRIRLLKKNIKGTKSLYFNNYEKNEQEEFDIADTSVNVEHTATLIPAMEQFNILIDSLKDREKEIVIKRFGLRGHPEMKMTAIADELGISVERARIILNKTLHNLKDDLLKLGYLLSDFSL